MSPHSNARLSALRYRHVRWIEDKDLDDLLGGSRGPTAPKREKLIDIYNGFLVLKDNKFLAVGPRPRESEAQVIAANPGLDVSSYLEWLQYHNALWDWHDRKPAAGASTAEIEKHLGDMPPMPEVTSDFSITNLGTPQDATKKSIRIDFLPHKNLKWIYVEGTPEWAIAAAVEMGYEVVELSDLPPNYPR